MNKTPPKCRVCGASVVNGNLYCSYACGQVPKQVRAQLEAEGFERDAETPNIYRKDGVAVTTEHVHYVGISKALQLHSQAPSS